MIVCDRMDRLYSSGFDVYPLYIYTIYRGRPSNVEYAHDMESALCLKQELVLVQTAIADASAKRDKLHADQVRQQVAHAAFQSFKAPLMRAAHGACAV